MGKIVKLKNKKTGVRVYPVTATSAVVDANSGERLNDTLQKKVEEAPMDGAQYVRKNGNWEVAEVSMDPNEICRINLKSNQGDSDNSSLNGATVNVVNTVTSEVLYNGTWDGNEIQLSIPGATTYKVTVGAVADYKTPDAITIEATAFSSRDLIMTYQTEVVTVNLSSDNGVSVNGQKVTINGVQHTWNGTAISQKVAFGVTYTVSVDGKTGYVTPVGGSFTSSTTTRALSLIYKNVSYGVFIYGDDGYLHEISSNYNGIIKGAALITENTSLVLAEVLERSGVISGDLTTLPPYIEDEDTARADYNGYENSVVLRQTGTFKNKYNLTLNGETGYLPALGEIDDILSNSSKINRVLEMMGARKIDNDSNGGYDSDDINGYISSTLYGESASINVPNAWGVYYNKSYYSKRYYTYTRIDETVSGSILWDSFVCYKLRLS